MPPPPPPNASSSSSSSSSIDGTNVSVSTLKMVPADAVPALVARARQAFASGRTRPLDWRRRQLRAVVRMIDENEDKFVKAAFTDLHKPRLETAVGCLNLIRSECVHLLNSLDTLAAPARPADVPLVNIADGVQLRKDPLGVVLVIGAWNYPFSLSLCPMVGALAAGNAVVVKPSELSANCAAVMADLVSRYLDADAVHCVNGAAAETQALLAERWDYIFYTGGTAVGKIIYAAATKNLTPVTLELGGKSPCIVDPACNLAIAARRITWGKFMNAGQTCIAPDYVLTTAECAKQLVAEIKKTIAEFYSDDPERSDNYGRLVNARHHARVARLIDASKVVVGGTVNNDGLYIAPTVLDNVSPDDAVMQEEIFGPLLPIVHVRSMDEALAFVAAREKPLALYAFTDNKVFAERVLSETTSGGATINDVLMHAICPALPFGGVGHSGMGGYHGHYSFDTFTHRKAVMNKDLALEKVNDLRYPPYTEKQLSWLTSLVVPSEGRSVLSTVLSLVPWNVVGPILAVVLAYVLVFGKK